MTQSSLYRLLLTFMLFVVIVWFWWTRIDELAYHTVGGTELVELGDATSFTVNDAHVVPNSYVSASGILGNKAVTLKGLRAGSLRFGRYQVRHLLGSKLYVEFDEEKYYSQWNPFMRVNVTGRLIPFGPNSELAKVRDFFKQYYNQTIDDNAMIIVMDETPRSEKIYPIMFFVSLFILGASVVSSVRLLMRGREDDHDDLAT